MCIFVLRYAHSPMVYEESPAKRRWRKMLYARLLRRRMTKAESLLWKVLRSRRFAHLKFRRQVPIDVYIVDFLCWEYQLILEIDGNIHLSQKDRDAFREDELEKRGFTILRFTNDEVLSHLHGVLTTIENAVRQKHQHPPLRVGKEV